MNILEKELEDIVFETDNETLEKRGLRLYGTKFRQVNLGSYGIADIVCVRIDKRHGFWSVNIQIVELKKEVIDVNTLMQASRYATGIKAMVSKMYRLKSGVSIDFVLIGKTVQENGDFCFLLNELTDVKAYTVSIDLMDGIKFHTGRGWAIKNSMLGSPTKAQNKALRDIVKNAIEKYRSLQNE